MKKIIFICTLLMGVLFAESIALAQTQSKVVKNITYGVSLTFPSD